MRGSGAAPAPAYSGAAPFYATQQPLSAATPHGNGFAQNYSAAQPAPAQWNGSAAPAPAPRSAPVHSGARPFTTEQPQYAPSGAHHHHHDEHQQQQHSHPHHNHRASNSQYQLEKLDATTIFPTDVTFTIDVPRAQLTDVTSLDFPLLAKDVAESAFTPSVFTALVDKALQGGLSPSLKEGMNYTNMIIVYAQIVAATTNITQPSCLRSKSPKATWLNVETSTASRNKAMHFFSGDRNRTNVDQALRKIKTLVDNSQLHERELYQKYARYDTTDLMTKQMRMGTDGVKNRYEVLVSSALFNLFQERKEKLSGYDIAASYARQCDMARQNGQPSSSYVADVPEVLIKMLIKLLKTVKQSIRAIDVTSDLAFSLDVVGGADGLESSQGTVLESADLESKAFKTWSNETATASMTLRFVYMPKNPLNELQQISTMQAVQAENRQTKWYTPKEMEEQFAQ